MSELNLWVAVGLSVLIVALSALFVAIEFSLVAARRHRLEEDAQRSLSSRAALRSARDLSMLLAGSQLGITLCTLALGAITKPAVQRMFEPWFAWLPPAVSYMVAFVLSLVVVTFVHLVVGEMAPKSWAISHPEHSATLLALPMRAFMWLTRPALVGLQAMANWCLVRVGVEPVDQVASGRNPDDLRQLVAHSARAGALPEERREALATALEVNSRPVSDVVTPWSSLAAVAPEATVADIKRVARESGHLRLVVRDAQRPLGVLHVRDALTSADAVTAADLMRPVRTVEAAIPIYAALGIMREQRAHLALVVSGGRHIGVVTLQDLLDELLVGDGNPATSHEAVQS